MYGSPAIKLIHAATLLISARSSVPNTLRPSTVFEMNHNFLSFRSGATKTNGAGACLRSKSKDKRTRKSPKPRNQTTNGTPCSRCECAHGLGFAGSMKVAL